MEKPVVLKKVHRVLALLSATLAGGLGLTALGPAPAGAAATVNVFPSPGSRYASPAAQIVFRGIPAGNVGGVTVRGSVSGVHPGSLEADSDGNGASFLPSQPFTPGETVTVNTGLSVLGATNGTFHFSVAAVAGRLPQVHWPSAARTPGDVLSFHSRPDLTPVAVQVTKLSHGTTGGFIFVAPQFGPLQDGPMILDAHGRLVWFKPLSGSLVASDFRVQSYLGNPVLTWWQGGVGAGVGSGQGVIYDSSYRQIAVVNAADGLAADMHEFLLTPSGTALITAFQPVWVNASSVHGPTRQLVLNAVVQEIDVRTGLLLFEWDSLDHIPLRYSFEPLPASHRGSSPYDYFHSNSVDLDRDGNLLISARNTWAMYKVDHQTGSLIWALGGRRSSFKLTPGTYWAFQHDARVRSTSDRFITLFDNSASPRVHSQSRGVKLYLSLRTMTAKTVGSVVHLPALSVNNQGNYQQLPNLHTFMGWGAQPYMTEYDSSGRLLFDAHFADGNSNYRAYKFNWSGMADPALYPPAVAASTRGSRTTVYASWNGATHVHQWRVLAGASPSSLAAVASATKSNFETSISVPAASYVAVQAVDWSGNVLATSKVIAAH